MSRRRKHVTHNSLHQEVEPPLPCQSIVRALGPRGGNIVEVEYPDGTATLCLMPAKFNKKLWVRRGGYLLIEESKEAQADGNSRITGNIVQVLYEDHIRQLRKLPGVWPDAFDIKASGYADNTTGIPPDFLPPSDDDGEDADDDDEKKEEGEVDVRSIHPPEPSPDTAASTSSGRQGGQDQAHIGSHNADRSDHGDKGAGSGADSESDEDGVPPLPLPNTNRRVVEYEQYSDSSDEG